MDLRRSINQSIKSCFNRLTGLTLYKKLPHGVDQFDDLLFDYQGYPFRVFFDVGANTGQSVAYIRSTFRHADVFCFEPVRNTFEQLCQNTRRHKVRCFPLALGSSAATRTVRVHQQNKDSNLVSLLGYQGSENDNTCLEQVDIVTLDSFCQQAGIEGIDYLKSDTEGFDLEVLQGARAMLGEQRIAFVEVETTMNPENPVHVDFAEVRAFLQQFGYRVYGLYEQTREFPTDTPILRRLNALFVAGRTYRAYQGLG
jgi:FkbM family methyltransferase